MNNRCIRSGLLRGVHRQRPAGLVLSPDNILSPVGRGGCPACRTSRASTRRRPPHPRRMAAPELLYRRSATGLLAEFPEERPYVTHQQFRRIHGGEVPASLVLRPLHYVVRPLRDVPEGDEVVVRKVGQRGRRRRRFGWRAPAAPGSTPDGVARRPACARARGSSRARSSTPGSCVAGEFGTRFRCPPMTRSGWVRPSSRETAAPQAPLPVPRTARSRGVPSARRMRRPPLEPGFRGTPVVQVPPVRHKLLEVVPRDTARPARCG